MPRIARVCAVNYPHHVTQRGNNKEAVFFDDEDREFYLKIIGGYSKKWGLEIWAYCLMPNHVHLLVVPKQEESLARGIGGTNLVYTQYINRKYERSGRLWQNRFYSTIIEKESYLLTATRYIERNPVRAKIVKNAEDYKWSSATAHIMRTKDDILSKNWLDEKELKTYKDFITIIENDKEVDFIRKATSVGRPLGTERFVKTLETLLCRDLLPKKIGRPKKKEEV